MNFNLNSGYGQILANQIAAAVGPVFGRIFVVVGASDVAVKKDMMKEMFVPDSQGQLRFYATVEAAYADVVSNADDVILLSGHSTHTVAAQLSIAKNRVHFIGMDGGDRMIQQGAKIDLADNTADIVSTIVVSGTRNTFKNLKIMNAGTHANSVAAVIGNGDEGTVWKNCSFQKLSDLGETTVSDFECRSDSPSFINCEFGFSTLVITAARRSLWFKASGATRAKDCRFDHCRFIVTSSANAYVFVEVNDASSLAFSTIFIEPIFEACLVSTGSAIVNAIQSFSGLVDGQISLVNPHSFNCTNMCATVTDQVKISGPVASAQGGEGIAAA